MKGILLAGGLGTRMSPITSGISKQLLPVFDKPMIYYPLATLIHAGVTQVIVVTNPENVPIYEGYLGDGSKFGISITVQAQLKPLGVAHSIEVANDFLENEPFWLILGDNLFHGPNFGHRLESLNQPRGCEIFAYHVDNPREYGVVEFAEGSSKPVSLEEKPEFPKSNWVIPGLYHFDGSAFEKYLHLSPSSRGELEILDLLKAYQSEGSLNVSVVSRGNAWFDLGSPEKLLKAAQFVETIQGNQGLMVGSPEEASYHKGLLSLEFIRKTCKEFPSSSYYGKLLGSIEKFN
jgi:glucose-1-phosphate thymidylyltransferase